VDYEELRPLVLEALKQKQKMETQIIELMNDTERVALSKGFYAGAQPWRYSGQVTEHRMPQEDREKVRQLIMDFMIEGILSPGINEVNPSLPFLKVTRHGKMVLDAGHPIAYDPEGYLTYLKTEVPNVDPVILTYVTESLQTFIRGNILASAVMLGVASEKAVLLLIGAYLAAISNLEKKQALEKKFEEAFSILRKFELLRKEFEPIKKDLRTNVADDLDIQLEGVFNLIRNIRNDAGHPTGVRIDRRQAYANLQLFIPYCKRVYDLITYFQRNPIS
jgi:hypothetical protein